MLTQEQQILEQIKKSDNILITFAKNWDGDMIASALAVFLYFKKLDKNIDIIAEEPINNTSTQNINKLFSFLPSFHEIKNNLQNLRKFIISLDITDAKVSQIKYKIEKNKLNFIISPKKGFFTERDIKSSSSGFKYDLVITIDTPDLESLGKVYDNDTEFFYKTPIINIDHHPDNEEFGQINLVELNAVATAEIVFSLFESYSRDLIDEDIATCILAGIISKTKSFKTPNITPTTLLTTSKLISMGARREEIVNKLYRSRKLNVLKLWGKVLTHLNSSKDGTLIWSCIMKSDFIDTKSTEDDLDDVIDELIINIPQAKVIVLFHEQLDKKDEDKEVDNKIKAVVYSIKNVSSMDLLKEYNPEGTKRIAQVVIEKPMKEVTKEIIVSVKDKLDKIL